LNKYEFWWGLGIGDWGLGIGDWAQSPIPNPHFIINKNNNCKKKCFIKKLKKENLNQNLH